MQMQVAANILSFRAEESRRLAANRFRRIPITNSIRQRGLPQASPVRTAPSEGRRVNGWLRVTL